MQDEPISNKENVDFALSPNPQMKTTLRQSALKQGINLGLTTDAYLQDIPLFAGVKVKSENGTEWGALGELLIWFSAHLEKLDRFNHRLGNQSKSTGKMPLSAIGFTVARHRWNMYFAYRCFYNGSERLYVDQPVSLQTGTFPGIFGTIKLIKRLSSYLEEVHWPIFYN